MMSFTVSSATPPQPSGVAQDCDNERVHASTLGVRDAMLATPKVSDERPATALADRDVPTTQLCLTSDRSGFCRS